ncbi:MAG: iron ABC transporter ATP-binding protein [Dehalococcoidia bacterium]|nr:iron ABC transporter ATP-binding protein [Dehalococcoidia bacterium]
MSIKIKRLSYSPNNINVLDSISLDINGGINTFLGQNGSGKTTLMKLISNLIEPTIGEVLINGINVKDLKKYDLSKLITYISQDRENIQGFTVFEYVEMGRFPYQNFYGKYDNNSQKFINESLKLVNLFKRKNDFVDNLSGGEMQILRISRALVQDTNIILFDEPTSNLDLKNTRRIKDLLFKLKDMNKRIIVSTHDINFANSISDIIFMIKNGKVIYSGDKEEILNKNNIIDCYDLNDYDSEDIRLF